MPFENAFKCVHLLLLILQQLLLLVMLDLLELLQLLELTVLLKVELLLLLRQAVSLAIVAVKPHHEGASRGRSRSRRIGGNGLPGVCRGEAVVALGDVRVRPNLSCRVLQYLIWNNGKCSTIVVIRALC